MVYLAPHLAKQDLLSLVVPLALHWRVIATADFFLQEEDLSLSGLNLGPGEAFSCPVDCQDCSRKLKPRERSLVSEQEQHNLDKLFWVASALEISGENMKERGSTTIVSGVDIGLPVFDEIPGSHSALRAASPRMPRV